MRKYNAINTPLDDYDDYKIQRTICNNHMNRNYSDFNEEIS